MKFKPALLSSICLILLGVIGFYLFEQDQNEMVVIPDQAEFEQPSSPPPPTSLGQTSPAPASSDQPASIAPDDDPSLDNPLVKERERILHFANDADYLAFLKAARERGLKILNQNSRMRAALVGYDTLSDLDGLTDDAELSMNFVVIAPNPQPGNVQAGALGFGSGALDFLTGGLDRSRWGQGITVAVLDTGVAPHRALELVNQAGTTNFNGELNGHGTAVASIIAGNHPLTPGVAPAAKILDIQIADVNGRSDSFSLAEGIIQAADGGAKIINISMGSYGDAAVVRNAIEFASSRGAIIVASAGNEGLASLAYPAAYPEVISVGAIDAAGAHLEFSNQSRDLSLSAPGFEVSAAWPNDQMIAFTGTSASAPFVSGALAAVFSEFPNVSNQTAINRVFNNLNEGGPLGPDPQFGGGSLDLGRIMLADQPNIIDPAIANTYYQPPGESAVNGNTTVLVQNRGTTSLSNVQVQVSVNGTARDQYINQLLPGETKAITVPTDHARAILNGGLDVEAKILSTSSSGSDRRIDNNQQSVRIDLADSSPESP